MLYDIEAAWHVFTILEAVEWKWPPDVIMRQDDRLMHDLIVIASANGRVREAMRKDA